MLGTFPPSRRRWCMDFFYPNYQNDMWRIFGIHFFADKRHFLIEEERRFNLEAIKAFLTERGIALFDTATEVVRTRDTASDKDLRIVRYTDTDELLRRLPQCRAVVTAGQLATQVMAARYGTPVPKMGSYEEFGACGRRLRLYRMPSSSRAYPMKAEDKAKAYAAAFDYALS